MLRRIAYGVEAVVGVAFLMTIILLFTNQPTKPPSAPAAVVEAAGGIDGAAVFGQRCAACHGGDGSGGIGPRLAGGRAVERFPEVADQIAVVTNGRNSMPSFAAKLSEDEIAAVVEYTRTVLAGG